ncbi:hypothetical protein V0288_19230 [Pannus brasiliensis CCIBt3594]|uniref:Uncharacterized protein n=1 Tax=Pannus brasiliensis CCIBt3594 TaxID=1427578 RepID=A0AAW9QY59_9CHRO
MAGLFGLFGGKTKYVDEPTEIVQPQKKDAFYLEPDDAKTLGNIEFMRTPNVIRRTFPKTASNQKGGESIRQISSMEVAKVEESGITAKSVNGNGSAPNNDNSRRNNDENLDMFLKMAREIKK